MYQKDEWFRIRKFIMGLGSQIGGEVDVHDPSTIDLVYEKSIKQEQRLKYILNYCEKNQRKFNLSQANIAPKRPSEGK